MSKLKQVALFALVCACALPAIGAPADDDDLAPLTPVKKAPAKAPPAKKAPAPAPVPAKRPPPAKQGKAPAGGDDDLAPLTPIANKGDLNVRISTPVQGAVLSVDGKELGVLPLGPQSLPTGEHLVTVKRVGFAAFVKKVNISAGKTLELEARLAPVAAIISVSSDVTNAQVFLNGRLIGTAPISDFEVPPGPVELSVLKEGFREDKQKLTLVAGKDYPVVVKFSPVKPPVVSDRPLETSLVPPSSNTAGGLGVAQVAPAAPIYQKWYFWVAVAAGVAAVAAGTAIGVSAAQPPGHYTPEEICGKPCGGHIN